MKAVALAAALGVWAVTAAAGGAPEPALAGFHPDPAICRVGDTYYLTTSSFTWYPGLPVYSSKDLKEWTLVGHAAEDRSFKSLALLEDCVCGLWAPSIVHLDGRFVVMCTYKDMWGRKPTRPIGHFIVSAADPAGPWSAPVWVKGVGGIDPSLFRDVDGKTYLLTNDGYEKSCGCRSPVKGQNMITLREFDVVTGTAIGEAIPLTCGINSLSLYAEGPHLYRLKNGRYLLVIAEGGTYDGHAVTAFLADDVRGPYVPCANNPVVTRRDQPTASLGRTGHADLVAAPDGQLYAVFLAVRREEDGEYSPLGRETFMCKAWFDEKRQSLFFDDKHLLAGVVREPKDPTYISCNRGTRLRRVAGATDVITGEVSENGCGLLVECSGAAMLALLKREGRIEVVQKVGKRRTLLASEQYAGEKVFFKMVIENGEIRCFFGPRAGEESRIGTGWPWTFLRTDTCHVGPGIGIVSGE